MEDFVGIDSRRRRNAIAIAEGGRDGKARFLGEVDASKEEVRRIVERIAVRYDQIDFFHKAEPTGYGLHRLITSLWPWLLGCCAFADSKKA